MSNMPWITEKLQPGPMTIDEALAGVQMPEGFLNGDICTCGGAWFCLSHTEDCPAYAFDSAKFLGR